MVYKDVDSISEPFSKGCLVTSTSVSTNKKAKCRSTTKIFIFLVLMCLCSHLPTGDCSVDRRESQNSLSALSLTESSSGEKQTNVLSRQQSVSVRPSSQPRSPNPREESNENTNRPELSKPVESTTKGRQESVNDKPQTQQRPTVAKGKPQKREEAKRRGPPVTDKQHQPETSPGRDRANPNRRQTSFPNVRPEIRGLCPEKTLVHYNVTFIPLWSSKRFPKMYPMYRPNAQWSKAVGRTHDYTYNMWKMDTFASHAVKSFAEEGYAVDFDTETQGETGIYDMFTMPAIYTGIGSSKGSIFLDGAHPLVSLMVKIVPSPDWFVGVSDLNLCFKGKWRKKAIVKLSPVDAGTDKGLTFTSPNWPSYPPEKITRITAAAPNHDASSFYYPKLKKLPRIGYVIFHKTMESKTVFKRQKPYKVHLAGVSEKTYSVLIGKDKGVPEGSKKPTTLVQSDQNPGVKRPETGSVLISGEPISKVPEKLEVIDTDPGTPLDCLVNKWSLWSECSKTCGFGRRERHRFVTQQRKNEGLICPKLKEEELCGSMRNCKWSHFQPFRWQGLQRPRPVLARGH